MRAVGRRRRHQIAYVFDDRVLAAVWRRDVRQLERSQRDDSTAPSSMLSSMRFGLTMRLSWSWIPLDALSELSRWRLGIGANLGNATSGSTQVVSDIPSFRG
jgi:hypothetical protein